MERAPFSFARRLRTRPGAEGGIRSSVCSKPRGRRPARALSGPFRRHQEEGLMTRLAQQEVGVSSDVVGEGTEVIALDGDFDVSHAPAVEQRLSAVLTHEQATIVIDLRGV